MRKFNSIKKSRKKSKDIDEKIEYLDKECQKTGLNEITMGTSGVYQGSTTNPNEKYEEFTAINFNGYPLAMSGDGKQGHQSTGGASIRASDGAAMAPPHPVTGEIRVASTKAGIDPMFKIAVPGEKPTPQHRMTGDILWFYNASYNGGQGRWQSLEYNSPAVHGNGVYPGNRAGWGYWGSNFIGFPLLRDDEKYSDLFAALNDSDGIQFNPNDIGTPTTTIFFQNDLGDPSHLPINIGEMSPEAFEYFRRRVNGNNNVASGGVNYDLYNYLHKRYGIGAANWYENNPTKPHGSNPNIPTPEAPYVPLASNSNDSRYSDVVSDTDINPGLGAKPGDQLAFGGFGGKPTPPTKKSDFKGIKRNAATTAATMSVNGMGMSPAAFEKKYGISPQDFLNLPENKTSDKKYLEEGVKLGHFEPEVLNVDINDIRKGIMPEFPKDPPPEMIGGYSAKSRLVRKDPELPPFIKVTRKDLAKNHKLTDKEIQDFLDDVKRINEYIKKNPAELIYAMTRYPKDDPRLAQLNFKMDEMKRASDQYVETHFPENVSLFNKLQNKIRQNIEMTDPKNFTGHAEAPKFIQNEITEQERRRKTIIKHFGKKKKNS